MSPVAAAELVSSSSSGRSPVARAQASSPRSAYDPQAQHLYVCASSVLNGFTGGGDPSFVPPVSGGRYAFGQPLTPRLPRTGVIAAMDMTTNTIVWRYR